jgi:membrane-bound lytic murein transglycosylase F
LWAVDIENKNLATNIHVWINSFCETKDYQFLITKYRMEKNQNTRQNQISVYDNLIKKYAEKINWDWRLIAALIYQESQFIPNLKSRKDAVGLMQLRQHTIEFLGFDSIDSNEKNIAAGTKLIQYLDKYFAKDSVMNQNERIKFVLAAYNAGHGKIDMCRRNTTQKHGNPNNWKHVEVMNQQKNHHKNSSKNEPFLSRETVLFVHEILERYEHYKNLFPE